MLEFEAVILACGVGQDLQPLIGDDGLGCMLHVGLKPMLSYPLKSIQEAGASKIVVVVSGDRAASIVKSWTNSEEVLSGLPLQVIVAPEGCGSVDALRAAVDSLSSTTIIVLGSSLFTDVPLKAVLMSHYVTSADMTVMLNRRKSSASAQTKPGRAPENVDYLAISKDETRLLFFSSNPNGKKDLQIPWSVLASNPSMSLTTSYLNTHAYVLSRGVLNLITLNRKWSDFEMDVIPFLTKQQFRKPLSDTLNIEKRMVTEESEPISADGSGPHNFEDINPNGLRVSSFIVREDEYCATIGSVQDFANVNKELAASELCNTLVGLNPSKSGTFVHDTVVQGNRATISTGCIVWEGTVIGDKTSVKRAVIGRRCRIASGVKVINSVILDNVTIGDNSHIHNSVISAGCFIGTNVQLKDCQVGPNCTVTDESEYKGEILPDVGH